MNSLKKLEKLLSATTILEDSMKSEQIHGLLCAVISSPKKIEPSVFLKAVYEDEIIASNAEEIATINEQILACHEELTEAFEAGKIPTPAFIADGKMVAYKSASNEQIASWCAGYMAGVLINENDWLKSGHKEIYQLLVPIGSFATLYAEELPQGQKKPDPIEVREKFLKAVPQSIQDIYDFWNQHQGCNHGHDHHHHHQQTTVRYDQPKTGRNEPCPCGSGKKFKRCCLNG